MRRSRNSKPNRCHHAERVFLSGKGNEGFFVLPLDDSRCALSAPVLVSLGDQFGVKVLDYLTIGDEDKTVTLLKSKG